MQAPSALLLLTLGIVFAVRIVGLATAMAVTLLGRVEYAVFGTIYFLTEVPLLLVCVALYRLTPGRVLDLNRARQAAP